MVTHAGTGAFLACSRTQTGQCQWRAAIRCEVMAVGKRSSPARVPWRKVLYARQPFADNYVDSRKFLDEMRKNVDTRTYTVWQICSASCFVSHQLSSVMLFVVAFCYMSAAWLHPTTLLGMTLPLVFCGYLAYCYVGHCGVWDAYVDDLKLTALVVSYSYGLSPILMTLTQSVSTDTIYTMTFVMLLAHLCVHDYGAGSGVPVVSRPLSMNAAVFAAVCLASRLPSPWHAFATLTSAMTLLVFLPLLRQRLAEYFHNGHVLMSALFFVVALYLLSTLSLVGTTVFVLLQAVVVAVCPALYYRMQRFKDNIQGPWDEALPDTSATPQTPEETLVSLAIVDDDTWPVQRHGRGTPVT